MIWTERPSDTRNCEFLKFTMQPLLGWRPGARERSESSSVSGCLSLLIVRLPRVDTSTTAHHPCSESQDYDPRCSWCHDTSIPISFPVLCDSTGKPWVLPRQIQGCRSSKKASCRTVARQARDGFINSGVPAHGSTQMRQGHAITGRSSTIRSFWRGKRSNSLQAFALSSALLPFLSCSRQTGAFTLSPTEVHRPLSTECLLVTPTTNAA